MPNLFKIVPTGDTFAIYEEHGDEFRLEPLKLNQLITVDAETGVITLTTRESSYIEIDTFVPTPDTTDDATLYLRDEDVFTDLAGNPIPEPEDESDDDGIYDDQDGDGSSDDSIDCSDDDDDRSGGNGDDDIYGNDGDDSLQGNQGDDYLVGGRGHDDLDGDDGYDYIRGDSGSDDISGGGNDDSLNGGGGSDDMTGGRGDDSMNGGSGRDDLSGGGDDDRLNGGNGDDRLNGGSGSDHIRGGSGRDALAGAEGSDRFTFDDGDFSGATGSAGDHILDFTHDEGDLIDLSLVDANTTLDGDQAFTFIGSDAFSKTAGELRFQQGDNFSFLYGDQNGDGTADFAIRFDDSATVVTTDLIL
jgi:Ca2+-binding RTX toxin-like protein